jgi:hypothetical protein
VEHAPWCDRWLSTHHVAPVAGSDAKSGLSNTLKHSCTPPQEQHAAHPQAQLWGVHVAGCVGPWLTQLQCGSGWPRTLVCGRVSHTQEWGTARQQKAQQPGRVVCNVVLAAQDGATCVPHVLEAVSSVCQQQRHWQPPLHGPTSVSSSRRASSKSGVYVMCLCLLSVMSGGRRS